MGICIWKESFEKMAELTRLIVVVVDKVMIVLTFILQDFFFR